MVCGQETLKAQVDVLKNQVEALTIKVTEATMATQQFVKVTTDLLDQNSVRATAAEVTVTKEVEFSETQPIPIWAGVVSGGARLK